MTVLVQRASLSALVFIGSDILAQQPPQRGLIEIRVAIVVQDITVRPVPLHELTVSGSSAPDRDSLVRTDLDGRVSVPATAGTYRVRSARPVTLDGRSYRWDLPVDVRAGLTTRIELTNANAVVESVQVVAPQRQIAPEMALYERVREGVLKIQAGAGHGTGFVVDSAAGLIATNDHVITGAGPGDVSVLLNLSTRLPAQVLARDREADLAVLRLNPSSTTRVPQLALASTDSGTLAVPGERVMAVGFPLVQRSTVTTGIVSGVRENAIITDANIDRGNSGGPLVNMAGQVIGVNTFRPGPSTLAGAVPITRLSPLIRQAREVASRTAPPRASPLPVVPGATYPISRLRAIADTARDRTYERLESVDMGNFEVWLATPVSQLVAMRRFTDQMARRRQQREVQAGLSADERYPGFAPLRDWEEYVGDETAPVVTVMITPKTGETSGSAWGRILNAAVGVYQPHATMEFKGDVQWVRFYRNGEVVVPIMGGRAPQQAFVNNAWVTLQDVAYRGVYVLRPEVFAPDSTGAPPSIMIVIRDLKHLHDENMWELDPRVVARVWTDFLPYQQTGAIPASRVAPNVRAFRSMWEGFCSTRNCWQGAPSTPLLASLRVGAGYDTSGVFVYNINRNSPLWVAGLRSQQIIATVNGRRTGTWAAFEDALVTATSDSLSVGILEGRGRVRVITARTVR